MHLRCFLYSLLVVAIAAMMASSAHAQQPQPIPSLPKSVKDALLQERKRGLQKGDQRPFRRFRPRKDAGDKLQSTQANLVTRSGTSLPNVSFGSHSTADLNGDGQLDLLITGSHDTNPIAEVYLGDGQGDFTQANAGLTGVSFSSTSIADVNGDGNPDLLISGWDDAENPTTTLYLGNGEGGFTQANAGLIGVVTSSTSIADVNKDGNPDLLVTGENASTDPTTTLYLGNGQGGFTQANAGLTNVKFGSTSIADVNGDENLDLLITGYNGNESTATLYLGDGQGGFTEANAGLTAPFGFSSTESTSIADVNGDGNLDLLIASTLYLGNGDGTFSEANAGLTTVSSSSTSIADVDGDGNLDLLITGDSNKPTATLYLGDGEGGFTEADAGLTGASFSSTSIADIDGDGDQDLLVIGSGPFGWSTRIYVNRTVQTAPNRSPRWGRTVADMSLAAGTELTSSSRARRGLVEAGDPDGDRLSVELSNAPSNVSLTDAGNGVAQVSFSPTRDQIGESVSISLTASDPSGLEATASFTIKVSETFAAYGTNLTGVGGFRPTTSIADVDGDGNQDLLIAGETESGPSATLYLGNGQGGFSEANAGLTGISQGGTSIADVDGDGNQDLLITGPNERFEPTATLYLGDGQGGFRKADASLTGILRDGSTSIADVDGDGNQDLLIVGETESGPSATLYLGNGQGEFSEANAGLTGTFEGSTSIADVNGDGNLDLLITGYNGNEPTATLYLGDGQGGFTEANAGLTGVSPGRTTIADVDGDGNLDLLITGVNDGGTKVYLGEGQGGFTEANAGLPDIGLNPLVAEVNGDGHLDLLLGPLLYLGNGQGVFTQSEAGVIGSGAATSMGDLNGDGNRDLLVAGDDETGPSAWVYENIKGRAPLEVDAEQSFGDASSPSDYQLVALPGQVRRPVGQTLGGTSDQEWKAYWDDGSSDDYLVQIDDSTRFRAGLGYWMVSNQEWTVQEEVMPVPLTEKGTHILDVHEGWNIISNPFARELDWGVVKRLNGTQQPLWRFDDGYTRASRFASATSGEAFYFYNDTGRDALELPYAAGSGAVTNEEAALRLWATTEAGQQSSIEVGYASAAEQGRDPYDQPAPPPRFSTLSLQLSGSSQSSKSSPKTQSSGRSGRWAGLYRPAPKEGGSTYEMDLRVEKEVPVTINVEDKGLLENRRAVLVERTTGERHALQSGDSVTIQPNSKTPTLRLLVGSAQYVRQKQQEMTPTELRLLPNAPNPVREQTTLRYALPEGRKVRIVVYDVLGRKVQTLVDAHREPGLHKVRWQVPDLSSGVYVARMTASGESRTQKLVVVR